MQNIISANIIAPCGLDCGICKRALTGTNPCPGCLGPDEKKPEFCRERCGIILCGKRIENGYKYCDECPDYPCADVMEIENRYTSKYPLYESPGKNLRDIRELGMEKFLENEREKFTCKECGAEFVFTAGEQEFSAEKGFVNEPQRCKACRDARKNAARGPREYFTAVCARCGKEARVPFEPKSDRPVYCSDCFAIMRAQG